MDSKDDVSPHAKELRKGRFSEPFGLYLITKCVEDNRTLGIEQRNAIVGAFFFSARKGDLKLHAFVVMHDHWHALLSLGAKLNLARVVENINRRVNHSLKGLERVGWQKGFHDRKIRMGDSVVDAVKYIENNPVRKGLVNYPASWQWSSAFSDFKGKLDRSLLGHERWE